MNTFQLNVNIKTVLYLRIVRHARYKIKISDVNPRPGKQASAARYRAAAHSLSSTGVEGRSWFQSKGPRIAKACV